MKTKKGRGTAKKQLIAELQAELEREADKKTKEWFESYLKHSIRFRGAKLPVVREKLREWHERNGRGDMPLDEQLGVALSLLGEEYAEDKLAGVLFL